MTLETTEKMEHARIPSAMPEVMSPGSDLSPLVRPTHIKDSYDRLVLVSHRSQFEHIKLDDDNSLIVTSDWLGWLILMEKECHALHIEHLVWDWLLEYPSPENFYIDSCHWNFADGEDVTLFHGISLGAQFYGHVMSFRVAYLRMWHALNRFCDAFSPSEIEFHDLHAEYDYVERASMLTMLEALCSRRNLRLINRHRPTPAHDFTYHVGEFRKKPDKETGIKPFLRRGYSFFIDILFRLRIMFSTPKPRVFVLHQLGVIKNLISGFDGKGIFPFILAEAFPKNLNFIWACLRKGILLARLPEARLNPDEHDQVRAITRRLEQTLKDQAQTPGQLSSPVNSAVQTFVNTYYLESGWLEDRAILVSRYTRFLTKRRISHVLVGHTENMIGRILVEYAAKRGFASDELPNGVFTWYFKTDSHNTFDGRKPHLTRILSWGKQMDSCLSIKGVTVPHVRTGYPGIEVPLSLSFSRPTPSGEGRALVLPQMIERLDLEIFVSHPLVYLVETIRALNDAGFHDIRIKLHPGYSAGKACIADILDHFGLAASIQTGPSPHEHIAWADVVVGPVNSGSMLETLAMGKPYLPLRAVPSSLEPDQFGPLRVFDTPGQLREALANRDYPDALAALDWFCDIKKTPNPAHKVWDCVRDTFRTETKKA